MSSSYHHLRPVPWNISDAVLLFAIHFLVLGMVTSAVFGVVSSSNHTATTVVAVPATADTTETQSIGGTDSVVDTNPIADSAEEQSHPVQILWMKCPPQYRQWVFVLIFISAVILAPLSEELLFRVVIQGALWNWEMWCVRKVRHKESSPEFFDPLESPHSVASHERRGTGTWRLPSGLVTILLTAGLFAVVHIRPLRTTPYTFQLALYTMVGFILAQCVSFPLSVMYLRVRGASFRDLGWKFDHIFRDIWSGVCWYYLTLMLMVTAIYLSGLVLGPHQRDVLPIFVFAVMLSWIYLRNRRFFQVVAMHAALNGTSLMMLYWQI